MNDSLAAVRLPIRKPGPHNSRGPVETDDVKVVLLSSMLLCVLFIYFFQGTITLSRKMVQKVSKSVRYTPWNHAV